MSMILSFGSTDARLARPLRTHAASAAARPGIMVGLLVALLLAAPFWLVAAYLARALAR